jgi:CheY-like chemotaxis protein
MTQETNTPNRDPRTVLLVDDDGDFLFQQKVQLEAAGFHVLTAAGQRQAEEILAQHRPDLAVVDLMMDNPDTGFTLCYRIRKKDPSIPVIMVTSVNSETGLEFDMGTDAERSWIRADALLSKPIRFEQLKGEIDRLLNN